MSIYHDEVEIEDFEYDEDTETYYYPCPCGDKFQITKEELESGEDIAKCPSCSLMIKVIYDIVHDMESKVSETTQNCTVKESVKAKIKSDLLGSKQEADLVPNTTELLNPSVLDEVLAEKKLALMRSPEVMKFLQSQQAKLAQAKKDNPVTEDEG